MNRSVTVMVVFLALCIWSGPCPVAFGQGTLQMSADTFVGFQSGKQTLTASSEGPFPGALFRYVRLEIPNRGGTWLGGGTEAAIGNRVGLYFQGWYVFPNNIDGAITLDPGATPRLLPAGVNSHTDWWYVDGFGTFRLNGPFSGVLGLRYDHHNFYTNDKEILDILFGPLASALGLPLNDALRLDLNALSTSPYFGFQWGNPDGMTLRVIYSPWITINVESTLSQNDGIFRPQSWLGGGSTLSKTTFAELFGQYSLKVAPSFRLAIFAKGTWDEGFVKTPIRETLVNGVAQYDISYWTCDLCWRGKCQYRVSLARDSSAMVKGNG